MKKSNFFQKLESYYLKHFVKQVSYRQYLRYSVEWIISYLWDRYQSMIRHVVSKVISTKIVIWYLRLITCGLCQANLVLIVYVSSEGSGEPAHIRAVSPEPQLLAHTSSESRGTFRQKAWSLAPLNGWACAVRICHDGMLEDTNSLDRAHVCHYARSFKTFGSYQPMMTERPFNCDYSPSMTMWHMTDQLFQYTIKQKWSNLVSEETYDYWASSWDYGTYHTGDQRRLRRACASVQSRQSCTHEVWK